MIKQLLCLILFVVSLSLVANAAIPCDTDATLKVHFITTKNLGSGNLDKRIFVGPDKVEFKDNEGIPLSKDGYFIEDSKLVEDVPGISVQRLGNRVRFLLYGSRRSSNKEVLAAEITLGNAVVTGFANDPGKGSGYPWRSNKLESQGDGIYVLGNTMQDEVFSGLGSSNASWFSTVTYDNDGFFLYLECEQPKKITCSSDSDCGEGSFIGNPYCSGKDILRPYASFRCDNPGTVNSACSAFNTTKLVSSCTSGCSGGECIQKVCGNGVLDTKEECDDGNTVNDDGCSSSCRNEGDYIYVVPYLGDMDGSVSQDWFPFYDKLIDFYNSNKIPVGISFYPAAIIKNAEVENEFREMYLSEYIELIQKGYSGDELEQKLGDLPFDQQKSIIKKGQDAFRERMEDILGSDDITLPLTYDEISASFTDETRRALEELGFNFYFDVYIGSGLTPVQPTETFDIIQYGVSFTSDGSAGRETKFKTQDEVIRDIKSFNREDVPITRIDGHLVLPLWAHQQDFESNSTPLLDEYKWDVYTSTLKALKTDPKIKLVTPNQVYKLRHNKTNPVPQTSICQFAKSAVATSENTAGSLAKYVVGAPDAFKVGNCDEWTGYGYSWTPPNWNLKGALTLTYDTPVYASNLTVFGDYDMCWSNIWLRNSVTGAQTQILGSNDRSCVLKKEFKEDFLGDTVILESCGWSWSATDAVELCGKTAKPVDNSNTTSNNITQPEVCKWKNCKAGAVSVSIDDKYTSCMSNLESYGYRGTYFLAYTNTYSASFWKKFNDAFKKGHELGSHTRDHWCIELTDSQYFNTVENNLKDITAHTDAKREDIISFAYPCGFVTYNDSNMLMNNWNFLSARGYNYNQLDDSTPRNMFDLRSYNSHGYPGGSLEPSSYFAAVDKAESQGQWLDLVFHNECNDDGVISYLPSKNVWVDTIGNIVKYIRLRDSAVIYDYSETGSEIKFKVKVDEGMDKPYYKQSLTLQVPLGSNKVSKVEVNNQAVPYSFVETANANYVTFDTLFPVASTITITKV